MSAPAVTVFTLGKPTHWARMPMGVVPLDIALLLIYFVYGLSFLAMGLALLLEIGRAERPEQARGLAWLAVFSLSHGTHEWFEAYLMQARSVGAPLPGWLDSLRLGLLAGSFACLLIYAFVAFLSLPR